MAAEIHAPNNPFHTPAPLYHEVRPAYPQQVVDVVRSAAPAGCAQLRVVDMGAGTGKLTLMLARAGMAVTAVEPSAQMLHQMPEHPRVRRVVATAEETTLPDASCDVVTYAQSWHWMDAPRAAAEAARITGPDGAMVLVWNQMDVSLPWVHRLTRIMRSGDVQRASSPPKVGPLWREPVLTRIDWSDSLTPEQIRELGTTRSSYLRQDEAGRARMRANLEWYLYEHLGFTAGKCVDLPYMSLVWVVRRA